MSQREKNARLLQAAEQGNASGVEELIAVGADINVTNQSGMSALTLATDQEEQSYWQREMLLRSMEWRH